MSLPAPATTEQVEAARAWVRQFYECVHLPNTDINSWISQFFQVNAILNFGNSPSLRGHKEIADMFEKQRAALSSVQHDLLHVDVFDDRIYVQRKDTFIVKNDPEQNEMVIKAAVVIWKKVDEDKLSLMDVYLDPTPLVERVKMFSSK